MTFWGLLSTSIYCLHYWKYKKGRFPSSSGTFHTIPYYSMVFYNVPWHSTTFHNIPDSSRVFQAVPPHSMVGPCGCWWVCGCLSLFGCVCICLSLFFLCGCVWSYVSLSSLGVALCGCVHKLVCEPMLCGLAVEPWGCVAGVVIAYLHSKYYKYSLCWVHAQHCKYSRCSYTKRISQDYEPWGKIFTSQLAEVCRKLKMQIVRGGWNPTAIYLT